MTHLEKQAADLRPDLILQELILRNGTLPTLRAMAKAALRLRRQKRRHMNLSAHYRRDIGLPTQTAPPKRGR